MSTTTSWADMPDEQYSMMIINIRTEIRDLNKIISNRHDILVEMVEQDEDYISVMDEQKIDQKEVDRLERRLAKAKSERSKNQR